jgi:LysM repeat protein
MRTALTTVRGCPIVFLNYEGFLLKSILDRYSIIVYINALKIRGRNSMLIRMPNTRITCPEGFKGRYVVSPGDTMYTLSRIFRVRLETLAAANPHIKNPNLIVPGDVICVPSLITIPCSVILNKQGRVPFGTGGVAFANFGPRGGQAVSVMATLPPPSFFGNYDIYTATVFFRDIGGFGNELFRTPEEPPTWSSRIELPTAASLSADVEIIVQPSNSISGVSGPVILRNNLSSCNGCGEVEG